MALKYKMNKVILRQLLGCILLLAIIYPTEAAVKLPHLISDGMILQRDSPLKLWGWASSNEKIEITFSGKSYKTKADKNGEWNITLPSQKAGGPYIIKINNIEIKNVLFGDVWLCSGQSNMELPVRRTLDLYANEIQNINNPNIRQFHVPMKYNFQAEEKDLQGGKWKEVTPKNILDFSAVAYFFAKELYDTYQIPIGIINTAIGGSPVEAWISEESLAKFPDCIETIKVLHNTPYIDSIRYTESVRSNEWQSLLNLKDQGINRWNQKQIDDSDWSVISLPGYWTDKNMKQKSGSFWFRKNFEIPSDLEGKQGIIRLGTIVDADSAFINGTFVGTTSYRYPPRIYNIPEGTLKSGINNIAVRVISYGDQGGFVEEKPYKIIIDKNEIDITGDWKFHLGAEMPTAGSQTFFQYKPVGLYNGMIAPLTKYAIKGFLWYQGESNTGKPKDYEPLSFALIEDWRTKWGKAELPFIYTQLANFMKVNKSPEESNWAELREAQRSTLQLANTGMAVTIDIGEWNDIHPLNKKDVGYRLALEARRVAYNEQDLIRNGPIYESMEIEDNCIILSFTSVGSGIYTNLDLEGFAIAGSDKKYVWAKAVVLSENEIKVWSAQVDKPTSVRYAWADNPSGANLKNKDGLPASPFTTDKEF